MGALEEDFDDNLDDIDESDLDEFLMNTDEQVKTSEAEKEEEKEDEEKEIFETEEDCVDKNDESKEEEETKNQQEETENDNEEEDERKEENLEEKESLNINMDEFTEGVVGRLKRKLGELVEGGKDEEPAEKKARGLGELVGDLLVPVIIQGLEERFEELVQERVQDIVQEVGRVRHVLDVSSGGPTRIARAVAKYRRFRKDVVQREVMKTSPFECPILVLKRCKAKRPGEYKQRGHFVRHMEVNKFVCLSVCYYECILLQAHHTGEVTVVKTGGYGVRLQLSRSFCLTLAELTEEELLGYERAERELQPEKEEEGEEGGAGDLEEGEVGDEEEEEDVEDDEEDDGEAAANNPGETNVADEEAGASSEEEFEDVVDDDEEKEEDVEAGASNGVVANNEVANNPGETNAANPGESITENPTENPGETNAANEGETNAADEEEINAADVDETNAADVDEINAADVEGINAADVDEINAADVEEINAADVDEINAADVEAGASNEVAATNEVANNEELGGETNTAQESLKWLTATMDHLKQNKEGNNEDKSGDAGVTIKVEPSLGARVGPEDPIYLSSDDEEEEEPEEDKGDSREQLLQKLKQLRAESKKREQAWAREEPRMKVEPGAVKNEPGSTPLEARRARRQLVKAFWASKTRDHVAVFKVNLIKVILI